MGVSGDGNTVVGYGTVAAGTEAFRWTSGGGMVSLGDFSGGTTASNAVDASSDGSVIVGFGTTAAGREAYRWTSVGGMVSLGDLVGGTVESYARAVSGNGDTIVGYDYDGTVSRAIIWDSVHGLRDLQQVLINDFGLGTKLAGWQLETADAISLNGRYITGWGLNPDGDREAYLVSVPEPSSFALAALVAGGAWWKRRRSSRTGLWSSSTRCRRRVTL